MRLAAFRSARVEEAPALRLPSTRRQVSLRDRSECTLRQSLTGSRQKQDELLVSDDALQEREARLRSILETAPDAIIVIDERGIIESFSPAAERLFGFTADEAIGRNVNILMPSPYHE